MSTELTIRVSEELLADLQTKANESGKTVDEVAEETLEKALEERKWQDFVAYGRERGKSAGFTEEQSADVVHQWRREQHR